MDMEVKENRGFKNNVQVSQQQQDESKIQLLYRETKIGLEMRWS